ncbi:hypothetical protein L0222_04510 [bacterium]|nr:hypothetical protein [bacterium]MCI0604168.1 hypothetical protein [bacterium]
MNSQDSTTKKVLQHLTSSLSISEQELFVEESPIPLLPERYSIFYAEKKGSHGHIYEYCILLENEFFSSAESDSFARLLKMENFLHKRNLNADQFVILFRMLHVKMGDSEPLLSDSLLRNKTLKRYGVPVALPSIQESNGGVQIVFYTHRLKSGTIEQWIVTVSRDYQVNYETPAQ